MVTWVNRTVCVRLHDVTFDKLHVGRQSEHLEVFDFGVPST